MKTLTKVVGICILLMALAMFVAAPKAETASEEDIEVAIQRGLNWLADPDQQNDEGVWGDAPWDRVAVTGLVVLKFETRAHELGLDPLGEDYEYHEQVENGLAYILANAHPELISPGDPDGNANGLRTYFVNFPFNEIYNTGIAMIAIAASGHPESYWDTLQDAVDYMAWAQADEDCGPHRGGWRYGADECDSDNSNSGYATLGLGFAAAAPPFGFELTVPDFVKNELSLWIDVIQDDVDHDPPEGDDGGSWYTPSWAWVNILKTGNLLYEMALAGDTIDTQRVQDAIDYIERHWGDPGICDTGWRDHRQAMFTMMKGFAAFGIEEIEVDSEVVDWFEEVSTHLVETQILVDDVQGYWPDDCWGDEILSTAWALLTLERVVPTIEIPVPVDIKPQSCPNPLNVNSKGVLSAAVLGTEDFDVTQVDPASIRLTVNGNGEGVSPLRWAYEDVATPFEPYVGKEDCYDCNECGPDLYLDLTLKFDKQEVVGILGEVEDGECKVVYLRGNLAEEYNGTPFFGQDVLRILKKK